MSDELTVIREGRADPRKVPRMQSVWMWGDAACCRALIDGTANQIRKDRAA